MGADDCVEVAARQETLLLRESGEPGAVVEATVTGLAALMCHLNKPEPPDT